MARDFPGPFDRLSIPGYDEVYRVDCAGAVAFVSLHAVIGGRAFGGVRIKAYGSENAAISDSLALARAMSRKVAMAGITGGGGKAVLVEPRGDRAAAVKRLGEFIETLGGRYFCGADYGFTAEDDAALREATQYVAPSTISTNTARTVEAAMRAVCEPRTVVVQGLGAVGKPLAEGLRGAGVRVIVSDVLPVAGFERVAPETAFDTECDVFAPCAVGGILDAAAIARLRCRVVCGAANNPLASDADAERLRLRGIDYVPDFLANVGATIEGASKAVGEEFLIDARLGTVGPLVREVMDRAHREGRSPHFVAVDLADERIERMRKG